jgi:seryl-tRNA synthetase
MAHESEFFLAPRAEPHLANLYAGEILDAARLPIRLACAGSAFRREAGGGRGLLRLHQFDTVELYVFASADQEEEELARAVRAAETILERLGVPHRRNLRPAPRLSHAAAKTIDLEVWAPGMKEWLAVAALSTFTDYQARRTDTRYRDAGGRARLVHTLGGAAVALPHLVAALLENGQEADGSVRLAPVLAPYFGAAEIHG